MSRTALLGTFVLVAAGLSGCASPAKVIKYDATTAVIAVPDDSNSWPFYYRDAADRAAADRIAEPYFIGSKRVKVGEQVTSTQDQTRHDLGANKPGSAEVVTASRTSTSDTYEYHLEYQSRKPRVVTTTTKPTDTPTPPTPGAVPTLPSAPLTLPGAPPITSVGSVVPRNDLTPALDVKPPPLSPGQSTNLPTTPLGMPGLRAGR